MSFLLSLDIYKAVFLVELLCAEALFAFRLERRKLFALRFIPTVVAAIAAAYFLPVIKYDVICSSAIFLSLFLLSIGIMFLCFKGGFGKIVFCAVAAYTLQHLAYQCCNLLLISTGIVDGTLGAYGGTMPEDVNLTCIPIWFVCYFIVYGAVYLLSRVLIPNFKSVKIKSMTTLILVFLLLFGNIIVNAVVVYASNAEFNKTFLLAASASSVVCCIVTLWVQSTLVEKNNLKDELDGVYRLYAQEQKRFTQSQTNVDLINRKCHDLKYQIRAIAESGAVRENVISEIENAVCIYDATVKTGNQTLDTILTEKSLICRDNDITFTCVVDGKKLDFINAVDCFTLFGNAIDNSLEAVMNLDVDRRVIGLTTHLSGNMLSVTVRNYYDGSLKFDDGLPVTTKGDSGYHGYGMKSIKSIVDKYNGDMFVKAENGVFDLNMLFFLPEAK